MFSLLLSSQLAFADDVLVLPFQVEGMTNINWTPHLENSLMDQLSLNRIAHVSPNQMTQEYGLRSFCVEAKCLREMLFRPESDLVIHGILDCQTECSLYLSVYDGFTEEPTYQKLTKGTYGHIKRQMPIVVAEISQYITKKYDLEYMERPELVESHNEKNQIFSEIKNENNEIAKLEIEK